MRQGANIIREQTPAQPLTGEARAVAAAGACNPRATTLPPPRLPLAAGSLLGGPALRACLGKARFLQNDARGRTEGVDPQGLVAGAEAVLGGARGGPGLVKNGPPHYL